MSRKLKIKHTQQSLQHGHYVFALSVLVSVQC